MSIKHGYVEGKRFRYDEILSSSDLLEHLKNGHATDKEGCRPILMFFPWKK